MARLLTHGNESGDSPAPGLTTGVVTTVTSPVNSGAQAWEFDPASPAAFIQWTIATTLGRTYYTRTYLRVGGSPSGLFAVVFIIAVAGNGVCTVRLETDRTLKMYDRPGNGVGNKSQVLDVNRWYCVETLAMVPTAGNGTLGWRLDGAVVHAPDSRDTGNSAINRWRYGKHTTATITSLHEDDIAVNDDQGTTAEVTWPGPIVNRPRVRQSQQAVQRAASWMRRRSGIVVPRHVGAA